MTNYTLVQARKEFSAIGYSLKTKRYSEFTSGIITHKETGKTLNSMMTREDYNFHLPAITLREKFKRNIIEGIVL